MRVVDAEREAELDDLRLVRSISGVRMRTGVVPSTPPRVARFAMRSIRRDVLRAAVGIAGVVERVHADEDVGGAEHLGPREAKERKIVLRAGT